MEHLHKMVMTVHPLVDLFVEILVLEVWIENEPDSPEILAILRQLPIANHREEMRQLFRLPHDTLNYFDRPDNIEMVDS